MAAFSYRAVDATGRQQKGVIEATSAAGARRQLRQQKLLPLAVEASAAAKKPRLGIGGRRLSARALATATRQLATLIGSDVRIEEALRLVGEQAESQRARSLMLDMRGDIRDGSSLATALARHPQAFPEYYCTSVAAGEQSGQLEQVLLHLAEFVENRHRAQQKIQLALLYPALLAVIATAMVVMMMVYVVPNIVRVFETHGTDLPLLTRILIGLSNGVRSYGWVVLVMVAIGAVATRRWVAAPANRLKLDRFLATRRPFARLTRQFAAARFASTLATLVESAVPLVDALAAAAAATPNRHLRAEAVAVAARVREGSGLARAMRDSGAFPPMLLAIVASGEASGRLGPALSRAGSELDRELDALVATLVALVEPAVLLLMGGIVMLLVAAILMPIVNLNNLVAS